MGPYPNGERPARTASHPDIEINIGADDSGRPIWRRGVLVGPETMPGLGSFQRVVVTDDRETMRELSMHRSQLRAPA